MSIEEKINGIKIIIDLLQILQERYEKDMERIAKREKPSAEDYSEYSDCARIRCEIQHAKRICSKVIDKYNTQILLENARAKRRAAHRTLQGRLCRSMQSNLHKSQYEQMAALNQIMRNIPI